MSAFFIIQKGGERSYLVSFSKACSLETNSKQRRKASKIGSGVLEILLTSK
jgi:hypothetical protein